MGNYKILFGTLIIFVLLTGCGFLGWHFMGKKRNESISNPNSITSLVSNEPIQEQEIPEITQSEQNAEEIAQGEPVEKVQTKEDKNDRENIGTESVQQDNENDKAEQKEEKAATDSDDNESVSGGMVSKLVSWGYESASGRKIDTIVVHSSYDALGDEPYDMRGLINEYKQYGVAAHYLIDRSGVIYQLVADKNIAYHAGESKVPDGRTGVNNFSVGIELMNTEKDSYTSAQYSALNSLIAKLKKNYKIKYVLGHKDIAPGRKTDPWGMNWDKISK
jgi:hypothetical protein